jgi:hypothetical protein
MALTNAEKQRRWRARNVIVLTAGAREIARRLAAMDDQDKLAQVVRLLSERHSPGDGRLVRPRRRRTRSVRHRRRPRG